MTGDGENTYDYDLGGNRDTGYTYVRNDADTADTNMIEDDGTWEYTYDGEGNITKKSLGADDETWIYEFDHANHLIAAQKWTEDPSYVGTPVLQMAAEYKYDVFGNRLEKAVDPDGSGEDDVVVERFALDGWNPAKPSPLGLENYDVWADLDYASSLATRYMRGDAVDQLWARVDAGDPYWYLTDHLGSIRDVVDDAGSLAKSVVYDSFGNITDESGAGELGRYAWTSREFDVETELQFNRARYYDGTTGTWISLDPLGFDAGDSNLYRYLHNHPANATDPSGLYERDIHFYMTYYLARAVFGKRGAISQLARRDGVQVSGELAYTIAFFTQFVDDNTRTAPDTAKNVVNGTARYWHFYSLDVRSDTLQNKKGLIGALKKIGAGVAGLGNYYDTVFPIPIKANAQEIKDNLKHATTLPNSDIAFGMVLHTYEDSWAHEGFQMPKGHAGAAYGSHAPDLPWLDWPRAMTMAENTYKQLVEFGKAKIKDFKAGTEWGAIKDEIETLVKTKKAFNDTDAAAFKNGDRITAGSKGLASQDLSVRDSAWQTAIQKKFGGDIITYRSEKNQDPWYNILNSVAGLLQPLNGPSTIPVADFQYFSDLYQEAYNAFKTREPIVGANSWGSLLKNVFNILTQK